MLQRIVLGQHAVHLARVFHDLGQVMVELALPFRAVADGYRVAVGEGVDVDLVPAVPLAAGEPLAVGLAEQLSAESQGRLARAG